MKMVCVFQNFNLLSKGHVAEMVNNRNLAELLESEHHVRNKQYLIFTFFSEFYEFRIQDEKPV